jgi:RecJ-like exonuclease
MKLTMICPGGCDGTGKIKVLRRRCGTCHGVGKITLTKYHKMLGNMMELKNVIAFEEFLTEQKKKHEVPVSGERRTQGQQ